MKELERTALLEIGSEEIPASYCVLAVDFVRSFCDENLRASKLPFREIRVFGTPRRLALLIFGLAARTETIEEEFFGPPQAKAKDSSGNWTMAALGFAKSQGTNVEHLSERTKKEVPYLCFVKKQTGQPCEKVLRELFMQIPSAIPFPKKMVWDETGIKYARPIPTLVAMVDKQILRIAVGKVKSGNKTFGLSRLKPKPLLIPSAQGYETTLKNHCILADPAARKAILLKTASQLAERCGGNLLADEPLAEEVTWLVEHPVATLCHFDPKFLEIPAEVLTTCMRKQQKFFSVLDSKGKLTSHFIAIRNGVSEHQDVVRKGYEKVLAARLNDAQFFFKEDLKKPLDYYLNKCSGIVIQEKLGTLQNKIERVNKMALILLTELGLGNKNGLPSKESVEQTVRIMKFDLATQMVYELPELQGTIGATYARHYGVNEDVAFAIREQYKPLTAQGELPQGALSGIVAAADKLDQLLGNFLIGRIPSGNSDPYGLRRHSTGILRIVLKNQWELSLSKCMIGSIVYFSSSLIVNAPEVLRALSLFLLDRFSLLMQDLGFALDEIYAVIKNGAQKDVLDLNVTLLQGKISALRQVRAHPDFEAVTLSFKRISNILKQAKSRNIPFSGEQFKAELLKETEESGLYAALLKILNSSRALILDKKYKEALLEWVTIRGHLDLFFEKVLVMDVNRDLCSNRLSLLSLLENLFKEVADFSYLQNKVSA